MSHPPASGPSTLESANVAPKYPMYLPRCRGGMTSPMIACDPTMRPPAPNPWIARHAISSSIDWESPESAEPTRNTTMASWKKNFRP